MCAYVWVKCDIFHTLLEHNYVWESTVNILLLEKAATM